MKTITGGVDMRETLVLIIELFTPLDRIQFFLVAEIYKFFPSYLSSNLTPAGTCHFTNNGRGTILYSIIAYERVAGRNILSIFALNALVHVLSRAPFL